MLPGTESQRTILSLLFQIFVKVGYHFCNISDAALLLIPVDARCNFQCGLQRRHFSAVLCNSGWNRKFNQLMAWRVIFHLMSPSDKGSTRLPGYCRRGNKCTISAFAVRKGEMLTLNVDATNFLLHGTGIYLAHVATTVALTDRLDAQPPRMHPLMRDTNSVIVCHDQILQRQHRLVSCPQPSNLKIDTIIVISRCLDIITHLAAAEAIGPSKTIASSSVVGNKWPGHHPNKVPTTTWVTLGYNIIFIQSFSPSEWLTPAMVYLFCCIFWYYGCCVCLCV